MAIQNPNSLPPVLPSQPDNSRLCKMGIGSLVLSVLGIMSFGVTAIFGIIFGHVAHSRIKKSNGMLRGKFYAVTALILGYGFVAMNAFVLYNIVNHVKKSPNEKFTLSTSHPPVFRNYQTAGQSTTIDGITVYQFQTAGSKPGERMQLRVYLPAGSDTAKPHSLPCVLVAPAGTNLLSGASLGPLDDTAYHDEALPYAKSGLVTVLYSIDGAEEDFEVELEGRDADSREMALMERQYDAFKDAKAGLLNSRNALEFVLSQLPMVDDTEIYAAGHSSAGTLALLFAMHEPRLAGCLAYAPCVDVTAFHEEIINEPFVSIILPGVKTFLQRSSPITHVDQLGCPLFFFHAADDGIVTRESIQPFITKAQSLPNGPEVTVELPDSGDHYYSMIDQGIPSGIEWIQSRVKTEERK
ncbi:DUF4190 domain-containing protein [Rubellicoccus peritrichatus]|uniref:DUF4190 domain-containing protein n=1 Tax=Rubellicoccus peritrichatus TaxID=3080537 RepID=A0AAQ3QRH8_9BACT|nr:DUF4190 domain-containing protein [Puniceicoccus sp. CR14]WOO41348.1 DUF4190 domain-containing protein [Puniceicoccus sp. CR14]